MCFLFLSLQLNGFRLFGSFSFTLSFSFSLSLSLPHSVVRFSCASLFPFHFIFHLLLLHFGKTEASQCRVESVSLPIQNTRFIFIHRNFGRDTSTFILVLFLANKYRFIDYKGVIVCAFWLVVAVVSFRLDSITIGWVWSLLFGCILWLNLSLWLWLAVNQPKNVVKPAGVALFYVRVSIRCIIENN